MTTSRWALDRVIILLFIASILAGCSSKPQGPEKPVASATSASEAPSLQSADSTQEYSLSLPPTFGRWTGDWDELGSKRKVLRMLTVYNKTGFFYDQGRPRGLVADVAEQLELKLNKTIKDKDKKVKVAIIPVAPGQLLKYLNDGVGDVIATSIIITPEREKLVDFTTPVASGTKLVLVTNKSEPQVSSLDDLSGKQVYVSPLAVAHTLLRDYNQKLKQAGKPEIVIRDAEENLTEEDMLEMTNAGVVPATVTFNFRAQLWSAVLPNIVVHPDIALKGDNELAWAMRKNSPQLKAVMDEFVKDHRVGTTFGNMMMKRYYKDTKFIKNATSQAELKKFLSYIEFFQKYGAEYNFDYVMLAAQAYQESSLQQDRVSPRGAVGLMQVLPKYAAADPINISNVRNAEANIHAGAKMLNMITTTYFNDPALTPMNKTLFTFASYNAGQNRIVRLRKQAEKEGLDPNKWFGNVELMVAQDIGQETVQYVSNIYKYYVAYKMAIAQRQLRNEAKQAVTGK